MQTAHKSSVTHCPQSVGLLLCESLFVVTCVLLCCAAYVVYFCLVRCSMPRRRSWFVIVSVGTGCPVLLLLKHILSQSILLLKVVAEALDLPSIYGFAFPLFCFQYV